jgi:inorganic triphosphatase YgiF
MRWFLIVLLAVLALVGAVGLWPQGRVALTDQCEPDGALVRFRASIQGGLFWRRQLREIDDEMDWIETEPQTRADARAAGAQARLKTQAIMNDFYAKYPRSASEQAAEDLRDQADALERAEFDVQVSAMLAKRMDQLAQCRPVVASRAQGAD